ncbi:MAG TPA: M50 family metallopeptidase, partial [Blastocatellia bacterium]|nr:M50 family metallopeptidase [Blastocatellia bacterium]
PQIRPHKDRGAADPESDLWPACIHEASHTVAALARGNRVQFTRLTSDGSGRTSHSGPAGPRANAIIALAGCVGERVLARDTCDGTESDFQVARLKGGKNYLNLMPETEKLIRQHRAAVLSIARELRRKRYLTGRRARQLFKEAAGPGGNSRPPSQPARSISPAN